MKKVGVEKAVQFLHVKTQCFCSTKRSLESSQWSAPIMELAQLKDACAIKIGEEQIVAST